jgi:2'-5' RNA ligase
MVTAEQLLFIAFLPPQAIQEYATEVKQDFATRFGSCHALKSPPHITLQPPFKLIPEKTSTLERSLTKFARSQPPIPITLEGFSAFPPRVIYIHVDQTEPLLHIHENLLNHLGATFGEVIAKESHPFTPHMTVAFRDLTQENFDRAWQDYQVRSLHFEFTVEQLTLLEHTGQKWVIQREFQLAG